MVEQSVDKEKASIVRELKKRSREALEGDEAVMTASRISETSTKSNGDIPTLVKKKHRWGPTATGDDEGKKDWNIKELEASYKSQSSRWDTPGMMDQTPLSDGSSFGWDGNETGAEVGTKGDSIVSASKARRARNRWDATPAPSDQVEL